MTVTKKAYAKINLTLEILGTKRNDGFHDIASVMHKAHNLYDEVEVSVKENDKQINLVCDKDVCEPKDNLAYRAADKYIALYKEKYAKDFGVDISIKKNIPAGAGLAGGSSDAAAVLDALSELKGGLDENEIFEIALSLGSDVPFCLEKHTCALCTGRGEIIEDLPPLENVKIEFCFSAPLSTKGIYGEYDKLYGDNYTKDNSKRMAQLLKDKAPVEEILVLMCNDFQPLCEKRCPDIAKACELFKSKGYYSQMSGSGSAVFAAGRA